MIGSMSLEEKFEALLKNYEYLEEHNEYFRRQLREFLKNTTKSLTFSIK